MEYFIDEASWMINERLYTTKEAAEILRVQTQSVRRYIMNGQITPLKGVNGRNLIPESELQAILDRKATFAYGGDKRSAKARAAIEKAKVNQNKSTSGPTGYAEAIAPIKKSKGGRPPKAPEERSTNRRINCTLSAAAADAVEHIAAIKGTSASDILAQAVTAYLKWPDSKKALEAYDAWRMMMESEEATWNC